MVARTTAVARSNGRQINPLVYELSLTEQEIRIVEEASQ